MPLLHHRKRKILNQLAQPSEEKDLPYGVRVLAWSRAIRWVGWGLGEALLPVFILLFSKTFAEAGLMSSTVDIASLLSLPLIGLWADKVSAKKLVLISLLFYPLVGVSYFLAGALGMAVFVVLARVANGFTWELENIGIETYYRRVISRERIGASFGFIETWSHLAWIAAALVGMVLVLFMPIYYLLFAIAPFALIAYFVALKAPEDVRRGTDVTINARQKPSFFHSYTKAMKEWRTWDVQLWLLGTLVLFSSILNSLIYFFIPIDAYISGANLPMVVLVTVFGSLPALFSYQLGRIADVRNKRQLIIVGLIGMAVIAVGLAVFPQYWFKLVAVFLAGIILELFYVVQSSLVTTLGPSETYGERGGAFEGVNIIGDLAAPLILGISFDVLGFSNVAWVVAGCSLVLALIYRLL